MGKRRDGMSEKMRLFSIGAGSGLTLTEAYKQAYDCERMAPGTIRREASKLAARPDISTMVARVRDRRLALEESARASRTLSDRERVLEKLRHYMDHAEPNDSNRIRATVEMGRACQLFTDTVEIKTERSSEEIAAQLEAKIAQIRLANTATESDEVH